MCMSPNTQQHGGPVIGTQKVIRVNFHAIPRASGASDIAARSARARELLLQARPDSVDVRSDADALLQGVHEAVAVVPRCRAHIMIPFSRNVHYSASRGISANLFPLELSAVFQLPSQFRLEHLGVPHVACVHFVFMQR